MSDDALILVSSSIQPTEVVTYEPFVTIVSEGSQGPEGIQGPSGVSDWNTLANKPPMYTQREFLNTNIIAIAHGMNKYPAVLVTDTSGNIWLPKQVVHAGLNDITIIFDTSFSGTVFLS